MDRLKKLLTEDIEEEAPKQNYGSKKNKDFEFIEVISYSIEEGLDTASRKLNVGISDLEYDILEKGSNGFLGIGKKPFRILVKKTIQKMSPELEKISAVSQKLDREDIIQDMDGSYRVRVTKNGVTLTVNPPVKRGRRISVEEVQNALYQRQILNADPNVIKRIVELSKGQPVKIGDWQPNPELDGKFSIEVSEDEMKVYLTLIPPKKNGRNVEVDDVLGELDRKNVIFGFKEDVIKNSTENDRFNQPILIAEARIPQDGDDAKIDYKFSIDKDVKLAEDDRGRVDFKELDLIENVIVGQVLAKKIPAKIGVPGKTVTGRELPAKDGKDNSMGRGKNTKLSDDGMELTSEINGQVVYVKGIINVEPVFEVKGDVSIQTGNVVFLGTVLVRGNVEDGFSIKAAGNIDIRGSVGKAQLEAEGDIIIKGGLLGKDEAVVIAGNDVYAKFVEHAKRIEAGRDLIVSEGLMHSFVDAGKRVVCNGKRAMIVGGKIRAGEEINAKVIGSPAYTETEVEVGIDPKSRQQLLELSEESRTGKEKIRELSMNLHTLDSQKKSLGKRFPAEKEELLLKMLQEKEELSRRNTELEEQITEIKNYLLSIEEKGKVCIQKEVFPKVKITVKDAFLIVKDPFKYVTFIQEAGNIKVLPYEEAKFDKSKEKMVY